MDLVAQAVDGNGAGPYLEVDQSLDVVACASYLKAYDLLWLKSTGWMVASAGSSDLLLKMVEVVNPVIFTNSIDQLLSRKCASRLNNRSFAMQPAGFNGI
jgi:hypothetical protein